jgi:hypothetical protein
VEGVGTLDRVDVEGAGFKAAALRSGFQAPTSVTRVGPIAPVSEGHLPFFFDQSLQGQSPASPFQIYAVPLSKGRTQ